MEYVQNYIDGQWVQGNSNTIRRENPSNLHETVCEWAQADAAQVAQAIDAAAAAAPIWRESTPQRRFDALDRIGSALLADQQTLGRLLAREEGKTLAESIAEVGRAAQVFKFFAAEALRIQGESMPSVRADVHVDVSREPVGVVGLITPWNFPFAIPAWKIAPALAYGNTVVFKPAELATACAAALARIIDEAAMPAGTFNMVLGEGAVVGQALVSGAPVNAISFTGSQAIGHHILRSVAVSGKKVQLEMGGKNPLLVLADADLDVAVECAIQGSFYSTGQRCTASSRLIVEHSIYDAFIDKMVHRMKRLQVGDALSTNTDIGPVVDAHQLAKNQRYHLQAREEGASLVYGGDVLQQSTPGYFMQPALWQCEPHHALAKDEVFGPIAAVLRADDYTHALTLANDTPFGLCAGICTTSLQHAMHFRRHAAVGMTMTNLPTAGVDFHVPFGGRKASSYGPREQGRYAAEFYTQVKTSYLRA